MFKPLFVILTGVASALQIGKAIVALPILSAALGLSLREASMVIACFAAIGAAAAFPISLLLSRAPARAVLSVGLVVMGLASLVGARMDAAAPLILTRAVEGLGFLAVLMTAPGLIAAAAPADRRSFLLGLWGAFMPTGTLIMLALGPVAPEIGWRPLWVGCGLVALAIGAAVPFIAPEGAGGKRAPTGWRAALGVFRAGGVLRLALAFGLYTCLYFAIAGLLPVALARLPGATLSSAALLTALAVFANGIGNVAAGWLMLRGVAPRTCLALAFAVYALAAWPIFSDGLSPALVAGAAVLALGAGGLAPASIFASLPGAIQPGRAVPSMGVVVQLNNLGQFAGPAAMGYAAGAFGWGAAPVLLIPLAFAGIAVALWRPGGEG